MLDMHKDKGVHPIKPASQAGNKLANPGGQVANQLVNQPTSQREPPHHAPEEVVSQLSEAEPASESAAQPAQLNQQTPCVPVHPVSASPAQLAPNAPHAHAPKQSPPDLPGQSHQLPGTALPPPEEASSASVPAQASKLSRPSQGLSQGLKADGQPEAFQQAGPQAMLTHSEPKAAPAPRAPIRSSASDPAPAAVPARQNQSQLVQKERTQVHPYIEDSPDIGDTLRADSRPIPPRTLS